jgi:dihydrofolate reductase
MGRLTVVNHMSLDGVIQGPSGPDEDRRGGFEHGGWAFANADDVMARYLGRQGGNGHGALLFGRRTYEILGAYWPTAPADQPFAERMNRSRKLVASTTLRGPLGWSNAELLEGDVVRAVAEAKAASDITVLGSGELVRSLLPHGLIDAFTLMIHPVLLGPGVRMFGADGPTVPFALADSVTTPTGVVIATYLRS